MPPGAAQEQGGRAGTGVSSTSSPSYLPHSYHRGAFTGAGFDGSRIPAMKLLQSQLNPIRIQNVSKALRESERGLGLAGELGDSRQPGRDNLCEQQGQSSSSSATAVPRMELNGSGFRSGSERESGAGRTLVPMQNLWSSSPGWQIPAPNTSPVCPSRRRASQASGRSPGLAAHPAAPEMPEMPFSAAPAGSSEMPLQHRAPFGRTKRSQRPRNAPRVKYGITAATAPHGIGGSYRCQPQRAFVNN